METNFRIDDISLSRYAGNRSIPWIRNVKMKAAKPAVKKEVKTAEERVVKKVQKKEENIVEKKEEEKEGKKEEEKEEKKEVIKDEEQKKSFAERKGKHIQVSLSLLIMQTFLIQYLVGPCLSDVLL